LAFGWLAGAVASLLLSPSAFAQSAPKLEQPKVTIAVGGITSQVDKLAYALALHKGFFKDEGLEIESVDFGSGLKGLQAMVGGSADVTQGAYEHTVRMQSKGVELTAFALFARFPGNGLGILKDRLGEIKSVKDLKGKKIGISAPGSGSHIFIGRIFEQNGLKIDDATYIAIGNGPAAIAASRKSGELDAVVQFDPNLTELDSTGGIKIIADSRTESGTNQVYGGTYLANGLFAKAAWVKANPNTVQALTNAIVRTQQWMKKATIDEIIAAVPKDYYESNPKTYRASVEKNLPSFLWDGRGSLDAAKNVLESISIFEPELKNAKIDLSRTFTNEFTDRALKKYP
jgi:NitT/TauT family transport system substrate-binding protein